MVEGRARERGQLAGFGGVYAGPPVEVLGTVGGIWKNIGCNLYCLVNTGDFTQARLGC